jgi:uncharacterized membrane protein YeaQ/YmgE (transglycosylase-associated protein family)
MNFMIWVAAGGAIGWAGFHFYDLNKNRGLIPAALICAVGGFMGGNSVAPMLTAATTEPIIGFSPFALVVAMATATAVMFLTNELSRRFDI